MKATLPKPFDKWFRVVPSKTPGLFVLKTAPGARSRRKLKPVTAAEWDKFERDINEVCERIP